MRDDRSEGPPVRARWVVTAPAPAGVSDGIGDYAACLVRALSRSCTGDVQLVVVGRDVLDDPSRVTVVAHQYFPWTRNTQLFRWIDDVCRGGGRLVLTVHEAWPPPTWSPRRALVRWIYRRRLRRVARNASAIVVAQESYARRLRASGVIGDTPVLVVPVGSAITRADVVGPRDGGVVLFGQAAAMQMPTVAAVARWMANQSPVPTMTWISRSAEEVRLAWERVAGPVPSWVTLLQGVAESEVSRVLARATLGLAPYAGGVSARRSSCAALLQHGVPTVAYHSAATDSWLQGPGLQGVPDGQAGMFVDAVAALWQDGPARARLSQEAVALYAAHMDWSRIAAAYVTVMRPEDSSQ